MIAHTTYIHDELLNPLVAKGTALQGLTGVLLASVGRLAAQPIRLRFVFRDADLFAFQFQ